ncbi:epithelial sodium channel subunit alpha-like isoform X2 [Amphiura filiformis]|uniref:epithelial sodium channel subunit alpha-like isoform X2 n=1 Tax=Amphiura filiformis TaxID=82378 RepID=UPI003B218296
MEDLILKCTYNEQHCSNISQFATVPDDIYGNCFTFNYVGSIGIPIQSTRAGSKNGLKMTLFLEQSEYLSIFGREGGVRVAINPADVAALPADEGVTLRPGTITSIGLRYENVSRLVGSTVTVFQMMLFGKIYGTAKSCLCTTNIMTESDV